MDHLPTLSTRGRHFVDPEGRVVWLRGANVGAASKLPNHDKGWLPLDRHREVNYIDRPFPLSEARDHLLRLESWGFTFLRITVTWEALEHAGPGVYDEDYLTYLHSLLKLLPQYGLRAFVCIHQDVWSRLSGGSGAPGWTLEAVGFDLSDDGRAFDEAGAAYLGGVREGGETLDERGRWPTGYQKLVCATMNTCFWAGDELASKIRIMRPSPMDPSKMEEVGVQTFLQDAFLAAFTRLVDKVGGLPGVLGFELLNEPHPGYVSLPSLHSFNYNTDLHLGPTPSALESFALGAGHAQDVALYERSWPFPTLKRGTVRLNKNGRRVWREDGPTKGRCLWEMMGVWGWDEEKKRAVALREKYFSHKEEADEEIDFYTDCYFPFVKRWTDILEKRLSKEKFLFVEAVPNETIPSWPQELRSHKLLLAPHWYDLNALFSKGFGWMTVNVQGLAKGKFLPLCLYFGERGVHKNYELQLRNVLAGGYAALGERPQIMGELGIPMDLNGKSAFETGDFKWQRRMMGALIAGLESNLVGFTLWNYNGFNSDEHGDVWNGENFSWFSQARAVAERAASPEIKIGDIEGGYWDFGARLLDVIVRPFPMALAGIPISSTYHPTTHTYTLIYAIPLSSTHPFASTSRTTEIFLPARIYGRKFAPSEIVLDCSEGSFRWDRENQRLYHEGLPPATGGEGKDDEEGPWRKCSIEISIRGMKEREVWRNRKWAAVVVTVVGGMLFVSAEARAWVVWVWAWVYWLVEQLQLMM